MNSSGVALGEIDTLPPMPLDMSLLQKVVRTINLAPKPLRQRMLSLALGKVVPFVGTSSLVIEEMTASQVVVLVRNQRPVQNHIGSVHAAAMALAAETASGFVTAMNISGPKVPLITSLVMEYNKRTKGDIRAVATLTEEQRELIRASDRGSVEVEIHATDRTGDEPIRCAATWAWVPTTR